MVVQVSMAMNSEFFLSVEGLTGMFYEQKGVTFEKVNHGKIPSNMNIKTMRYG